MPAARAPSHRRFVIIALAIGVLLSAAVMILSAGGPAESRGHPSSYSRASDGALAAFLLLKELDFDIERWEQPPTELPEESSGAVLIFAEPKLSPSAEERTAIHQFAARGGTVLATGTTGARLIPGGSALWLPEHFEWKSFTPQVPSGLVRSVREIRMDPSVRWMGSPSAVPVFADASGVLVVTYRYGAGRIVWWGTSSPLTNGGLSAKDNLQFFLNSIGASENPRIFWDEYLHGVRRSLWTFLAGTPAPWVLAQMLWGGRVSLAVGMVALLTFARRHGPLRPATAESRLHPLEFVYTLGSLYQHAQVRPFVVGSLYQRLRHRLLRQLGLPASCTAATLARAIKERRGELPDLQKTLEAAERCAAGAHVSNDEALRLAARLQDYAEKLRLNPAPPSSSAQRKT